MIQSQTNCSTFFCRRRIPSCFALWLAWLSQGMVGGLRQNRRPQVDSARRIALRIKSVMLSQRLTDLTSVPVGTEVEFCVWVSGEDSRRNGEPEGEAGSRFSTEGIKYRALTVLVWESR